MIDDDEQAVGDCYGGLQFAQTPGQPMILSREIVLLHAADVPDRLDQHCSQTDIALGSLAREPLAPTLFVAWTHARPGRQMLGGGKPTHLHPNFRQNSRRSNRLNTWDTQQQLHRLRKWAQSLLNLLLQVLKAVFQKADMGEDLPQQHTVLRFDLSVQCLLQLGQFVW